MSTHPPSDSAGAPLFNEFESKQNKLISDIKDNVGFL